MTAHAEWKYVTSTTNLPNNFDSYIDYSRIRTEGRYKSMWTLANFSSPVTTSNRTYNSRVVKWMIDCQGRRTQPIAHYDYSEQMSNGQVVDSENFPIIESGWQNPPPNSVGDGYVNIACGRK